jgi:hypothetical protein
VTLPRLILGAAVLAVLAGLVTCDRDPGTPEAQIRSLVTRAELAAEAKDLRALRAFVSERYHDDEGNDREQVLRLLAYHFLRNRFVHVVTAVSTIRVRPPDRADAAVFAGLAGRASDSFQDALLGHADLYRFDLRLVADAPGEWTVEGAAWRPAEVGDLGSLRSPAGG